MREAEVLVSYIADWSDTAIWMIGCEQRSRGMEMVVAVEPGWTDYQVLVELARVWKGRLE